eukprot:5723927-Prymnesium_polylepis.1
MATVGKEEWRSIGAHRFARPVGHASGGAVDDQVRIPARARTPVRARQLSTRVCCRRDARSTERESVR